MLQASVPYCFSAAKDARHEFQKNMVEIITSVIIGVQVKPIAAVQAAEALAGSEAMAEASAFGAVGS